MPKLPSNTRGWVPKIRLRGEPEKAYPRHAAAALRESRLNNFYPDANLLARHIELMSPGLHQGLYPGLDLDRRSGLPVIAEWERVQIDVESAAKVLSSLRPSAELERQAGASSFHLKQLKRRAYYQALLGQPTIPLCRTEVVLRKFEPGSPWVHFRTVLEKLDDSGLFVRTTVHLAQDTSNRQPFIALTRDTATFTRRFKGLLDKLISLDAAQGFAALAEHDGIRVDQVIRGAVGPFFFSGVRPPEALRERLPQGNELLATFSLDMAARDLAADGHNDPLADWQRGWLAPKEEQRMAEAQRQLGFKVFRDRKFVVPECLVAPVLAFCAAHGTQNVVYALRA